MSKQVLSIVEADVHVAAPPQKRKDWRRFVWDSFDKSPEERHFIFKLDLALLTFGCLGFFIKFLDAANLVNAFVSGMKEDLNMFGNQLNYVTTAYTVGYILGEIPSNVILTRVRPSIWLPTLEVVWAVLTMCLASCTNITQLYVLRFLIGLSEGGFYPGLNYMIGSWYRKDEIAKRSGILNASGSVATIFSGFLMSAVINLGGKGGLAVISLPIAFASFYFLPDTPDTNRGSYFTEAEIVLAKKRMVLEGRKPRAPYTVAKVKKILTSWHIWLFSLLYSFFGGTQGTPIFPQYLKDAKKGKKPRYNLIQINNYPSFTFAVAVVAAVAYAWISDSVLGGRRWPLMIFAGVFQVILFISLAVWNIAEGWRWACYILYGQALGLSGIINSWANEVCSNDNEERAVVLASMNMMNNVLAAWLPLLVWNQVDAPKYHKGFITATCTSIVFVIASVAVAILQKREDREKSESVEEGLGSEREAVQEWKEDPELDIKRANAELGGYGEDIKGA
ncbi:MFS general substrate transporter [Hyaloscypha variabilis F]|uniref:MFS general substrate transporter n=1 Tax=Hyaloscypha variabilis (strain UAMH 11265 / GT02V1 / F) TaxID=1149755 RepID=A0A2J6RG93_HYAVF|nr:MFS general substrate transporter [Hyaloscypha variabilis F]